MSGNFVQVAQLRELGPGKLKQVRCDGQELTIANVGGTIHAFDAYCPHAAWPLRWGGLDVGPPATVQCGLHGWVFDITNGDAIIPPETHCLPIWEARVVDDEIEVRRTSPMETT